MPPKKSQSDSDKLDKILSEFSVLSNQNMQIIEDNKDIIEQNKALIEENRKQVQRISVVEKKVDFWGENGQ